MDYDQAKQVHTDYIAVLVRAIHSTSSSLRSSTLSLDIKVGGNPGCLQWVQSGIPTFSLFHLSELSIQVGQQNFPLLHFPTCKISMTFGGRRSDWLYCCWVWGMFDFMTRVWKIPEWESEQALPIPVQIIKSGWRAPTCQSIILYSIQTSVPSMSNNQLSLGAVEFSHLSFDPFQFSASSISTLLLSQ